MTRYNGLDAAEVQEKRSALPPRAYLTFTLFFVLVVAWVLRAVPWRKETDTRRFAHGHAFCVHNARKRKLVVETTARAYNNIAGIGATTKSRIGQNGRHEGGAKSIVGHKTSYVMLYEKSPFENSLETE